MAKNNKENQLQVIIRESGLEKTKAQYFLANFQDYFSIASEWEKKAKMIKVTDANQTDDMKMARAGRLILREKRIDVEKARKRLKEDYLRGGKLVDHIAGVLKELILPIENYLDKQEHFIEMQEEAKRETIRLEVEKRIEDERIAKEKADAEALEKEREKNKKLEAEAKAREKKMEAERKKKDALLAKEREKADVEKKEHDKKLADERKKADEEKKAIEEKARKNREKAEKERKEQVAIALKKDEEAARKQKEIEERARKEREKERIKAEEARKEKERLEALLKNQITCPNCGHKFQRSKEK